jgi:hypothetical protein
MQGNPTAHRGTDDGERSLREPIDERQRLVQPALQSAVLEPSFGRARARIVEPQHGAAFALRKAIERQRLGALHVRSVAGQEDERRSEPFALAAGEPRVRTIEIGERRLSHRARMFPMFAVTCVNSADPPVNAT